MGITIHHAIGVRVGRLKDTLDHTQRIAETIKKEQADKMGISFTIRRESEHCMLIDIGNCETLGFVFKTFEDDEAEAKKSAYRDGSGLRYYFAQKVLETADSEHLKSWPEQRLMWCNDFCKTQFSHSSVEHLWVAELIRSVAQVADYAHVHDEGDYYHTGKLEDAENAIAELGAMLSGLGARLGGMGWDVVKGGETKVKPRKRKVCGHGDMAQTTRGCIDCEKSRRFV